MTRNDLIAAVARRHIAEQLQNEDQGTLRICMIGLESSIVRAIASTVNDDVYTRQDVLVKINPEFDPDHELDEKLRADESITHWRHCPLPNGKRAILFAATQEELQRNHKSVEKITKIETDSLRTLYDIWIREAGLTLSHLDEVNQTHLKAALRGADETNVARTIEYFADFVLDISTATLSEGLPIHRAVDSALPVLHLPRNSGQFTRIVSKRRGNSQEWAKIYTRLHRKIRPFLYRSNERGEPIQDNALNKNLASTRDQLSPHERDVIENFLKSDVSADQWTTAQSNLVKLDWIRIRGVFEGPDSSKSPRPLGDRTIEFFQDEFEDPLEEDDRHLLSQSFPKEAGVPLVDFFQDHQEHIARNKKLYSSWEKYIYGKLQPFEDFFNGFLQTLYHLLERTSDVDLTENKIVVQIPRGHAKSFWQNKNSKIMQYFAVRYRGIQNLFGTEVEFKFGKLYDFYFPQLTIDINNPSRAREARSLKFEMVLDPTGANSKLMFIWEMPVDALAVNMADDLNRIANESNGDNVLLSTSEIARQTISSKGKIQRISLDDVNTIIDVNRGNDGVMVSYEGGDRAKAFLNALSKLSNLLSIEEIQNITNAFEEFKRSYEKAIRDWVGIEGKGISSNALLAQAEKFANLLDTLLLNANNDRAREGLWKECLLIGIAYVNTGTPAALILPWHPLRMCELHIKAFQLAENVKAVLRASKEEIYRADLLFQQKKEELLSDYYPEVCIGFENDSPLLLSITESKYGYSLAESTENSSRTERNEALDFESTTAAKAFSAVGEQFLKLLPHEQNNFSIVLYNTESKALPSALASELSKKVHEQKDLQCDLLLTHSDTMQMRKIYEQQNAAVEDDSSSFTASEAAKNFLSRLRVGFLETNDLPDDDNGRKYDLIALQDVISNSSQIVWKSAPLSGNPPDLLDHIPHTWSRRRPVSAANTSTAVYLTAPLQPKVGQSYLNALHVFLKGENAQSGDVIPAREVGFQPSAVREAFLDAHRIGEWVVNFDELVDRQFLRNNDITVIRHIHDRSVGRNITVSTKSNPRLLQTLIKKRVNEINPHILKTHGDSVVQELIDEANTLSGHVVMRAARYGHFANELLGIVLSMEFIKSSLGDCSLPIGWYFLDDYASWFGKREEQIADIMAIAPRMEDGKPVLRIAIAEAKFVGANSYKIQAKKSAKQLEETISRVGRALEVRHRIDRESWLHRLGDFIINGMEPFDSKNLNDWDLHRWSLEVRQDRVRIILAGFSHVFVHDTDQNIDSSEPIPLGHDMPHCYQQIFDKSRIAAALKLISDDQRQQIIEIGQTKKYWTTALSSTPTNADQRIPSERRSSQYISTEEVSPELSDERPETTDPVPEATNSSQGMDEQPEISPKNQERSTALNLLPEKLSKWFTTGSVCNDSDAQEWLKKIEVTLQKALRGYDLSAQLIGSRLTPNAARIRFKGSDDLTIPKVEKRRQELLTSHAINVINVIPAPMEVIIMVARPERDILHLKDLWSRRELPDSAPETNSNLLLGERESDGELIYLNVESGFGGLHPHGPHTLIAGETGSGKGVLVQCLLLDICATNSPRSARIQMIDPKAGIDFPWLRSMPHLDGDLITNQEDAIATLNELVDEMNRRYRLLANCGVTKLSEYNYKVNASERLPRIWLFHDELADWMLIDEYRDAVELNVSRLGVKARAAGINLVLITQRPDKNVLPMQLRANLTNRLVLKVADKLNSKLVLGETGAENLLGRGHLAAKLSGEVEVMYAQVPFADGDEMAELAELITNSWSEDS